jgi:hypothetical protein
VYNQLLKKDSAPWSYLVDKKRKNRFLNLLFICTVRCGCNSMYYLSASTGGFTGFGCFSYRYGLGHTWVSTNTSSVHGNLRTQTDTRLETLTKIIAWNILLNTALHSLHVRNKMLRRCCHVDMTEKQYFNVQTGWCGVVLLTCCILPRQATLQDCFTVMSTGQHRRNILLRTCQGLQVK